MDERFQTVRGVLVLLKSLSEGPVSTRELVEALSEAGVQRNERTVRRWLEVMREEGFGVSVSKKSERLVVKRKGEVVFERPFFEVERVIVSTVAATVSAAATHECVENGIPVEFLSFSGVPYASLVSPSLGGTVKTRRAQLLAYGDLRGVILGKAFATGKLKSAANNLKYYAKYRKGADRAVYDYLYQRVDKIETLASQVAEIQGDCVDEVRGALLNAEG